MLCIGGLVVDMTVGAFCGDNRVATLVDWCKRLLSCQRGHLHVYMSTVRGTTGKLVSLRNWLTF